MKNLIRSLHALLFINKRVRIPRNHFSILINAYIYILIFKFNEYFDYSPILDLWNNFNALRHVCLVYRNANMVFPLGNKNDPRMENQHAPKHVMSLQRNNANLGVRKCSKINVLLNREKIIYSPGHSSCFVEYFVLIIFTYYYKIFTSRAGRKEEFNSDTKVFINKWAFYVRIRFITPKNANYIQIRLLLLNSKRRYVTRIL